MGKAGWIWHGMNGMEWTGDHEDLGGDTIVDTAGLLWCKMRVQYIVCLLILESDIRQFCRKDCCYSMKSGFLYVPMILCGANARVKARSDWQ
jgi:hypothetical protein